MIQLCLGIDPNPTKQNFENFRACVQKHIEFIDSISQPTQANLLRLPAKPSSTTSTSALSLIKVQFGFFLAYGSKGITLLEDFVERYRDKYSIILDGKFNDISHTLNAYLKFAFEELKVHGLTISPFLGEKTLEISFEACAKYAGDEGRVYVLCATSEASTEHLAFIQKNWQHIIAACAQVRDEVFSGNESLKKIAGVVIGANREKVLFSQKLINSELSVLSPGLGAQGAPWQVVQKCAAISNEVVIPISRGIFEGGNISISEMETKFYDINQKYLHWQSQK